MKIKIQSKYWSFKDSYNDFTITDIKNWMSAISKIEKISEQIQGEAEKHDALYSLVDMGLGNQAMQQSEEIELNIDFNKINLAEQMINLLWVCSNQKSIKFYLENTNGITYAILTELVQAILDKYGAFVDYFNSCKSVEVFKHKSKQGYIMKKYKVQDMDKNTLMRDALATVQSQTAFNYKLEISGGAWDNICRFVALVARPIKQEFEISFSRKSFINANEISSLNYSDRATIYQQALEKDVNKRSIFFENLLLPIAIGVLMCYEKKKQKLEKDGKIYLVEAVIK